MDIMYKIIENRVSIRDDYNGKTTIGFLEENEIIYPIKILNNWAMIIYNDKYRWFKLYDDKTTYAIKVDAHDVSTVESNTFSNTEYSVYLDSIQ